MSIQQDILNQRLINQIEALKLELKKLKEEVLQLRRAQQGNGLAR